MQSWFILMKWSILLNVPRLIQVLESISSPCLKVNIGSDTVSITLKWHGFCMSEGKQQCNLNSCFFLSPGKHLLKQGFEKQPFLVAKTNSRMTLLNTTQTSKMTVGFDGPEVYHIIFLYLKGFFPSVEGIMKHFEFNCRSQMSNIPYPTPIIWRVSTLSYRITEEATGHECRKHEYSSALPFITQLDQHSREADTMAYVLTVIKLAI